MDRSEIEEWLRQEDSDSYFIGCPNLSDRPALVHIVRAGAALCGMRYQTAHRELQKALDLLPRTKGGHHKIHPLEIDSLDEINGDEQLALVWCQTHQKWEWHWVPREDV